MVLNIYSTLTDIFINKSAKLEYMRESELRVIDYLRDHSYSVGDLADEINNTTKFTNSAVTAGRLVLMSHSLID